MCTSKSLHNPDLQVQSGRSSWPLAELIRNVIFEGVVVARRMLLFMVEQVFLVMQRSGWCIMQIQGTEEGRRRSKGREFLFLYLSYLTVKYVFYFTPGLCELSACILFIKTQLKKLFKANNSPLENLFLDTLYLLHFIFVGS